MCTWRRCASGTPIKVMALGLMWANLAVAADPERVAHPIAIRGIYGGVPTQLFDRGRSLADLGINAVWIGSGSLTRERIELLRRQGARVFAEFNTMHDAAYLKDHPWHNARRRLRKPGGRSRVPRGRSAISVKPCWLEPGRRG